MKPSPMRQAGIWLLVLLPGLAQAYEYEFFEHATVSARISTLGVGGELSVPLVTANGRQQLALRAGVNGFQYNSSTTKDNVRYDTGWNLFSSYGLLDWYPWGGVFRLSGGIVLNFNKVDVEARPTAGGFNFGGVNYAAGNVDKVDGTITFNRLAPYFGLGWDWGSSGSGLSFSADLGLMYQGSPAASLSANCGPLLTAPQCATLRSDVEQEEDDLNDALKGLKWYPVAALNGTYRF